MRLNNRYIHRSLTIIILLVMVATAVVLWRGVISIEWLTSFGYKGIFVLSLINSMSPVAGPSQIATFFVASRLNPLWLGVVGGAGGAIGEITGYLFGYSFRASLSEESEHKFERFGNWRFIRISRERSFVPLFVLASIPNPFFDPASALAGSLRITFTRYFVPVLFGRMLRHVVIAYAGYYTTTTSFRAVFHSITNMTVINLQGFAAGAGNTFFAWLARSFC
jgi:membrane protein YqaA with SNARE-associated domain